MIRSATEADIPEILECIRALSIYEKLEHEVEATEERLRATLFSSKPSAECLLALSAEGKPAGFALFFTNYSTFLAKPGLYLEDLFVKPEYRGAGFGKALLLHLAKLANARGCGGVEWSVLDWNEPAKGFYRSLGAKQMDDWRIFRLTGEALSCYR